MVAVAEPRAFYRQRMADQHAIPAENSVDNWQDLASGSKFAVAVIIAIPDRYHAEPA